MKLTLHRFDLRLSHTFTIAHDSRDVQPVVIVELTHEGFSGYGEAPSNDYYGISLESVISSLNACKETVETLRWDTPEELWELAKPIFKDNAFAQCALDVAAHDLHGKRLGKRLVDLWGYDTTNNPLTDYTIGIDSIEKMVDKMEERPWPIYKIKLGTNEDIAIVEALRKHSDAIFRVDANCAWTPEQAIKYSRQLKNLGVEFIEQPLKADDWDGMKLVNSQSALPVIADESCEHEADVERCSGFFHGVNIKLTKCGGLTPAKRMLAQAHKLGLRTMAGCMNESSVGISAIAHLLPLLHYVDMDGTLLLANDPAQGVTFANGRVLYANEKGTGASLRSV